ncbi:hypothetical protein BaRGS_00015668 [Batillaria attramentaria]|uniref:Uncharacterized protein n=1 Tax=Batillaria attramentaria TaxID=370345 RepID=A0ABD0L165_9CAEN
MPLRVLSCTVSSRDFTLFCLRFNDRNGRWECVCVCGGGVREPEGRTITVGLFFSDPLMHAKQFVVAESNLHCVTVLKCLVGAKWFVRETGICGADFTAISPACLRCGENHWMITSASIEQHRRFCALPRSNAAYHKTRVLAPATEH